MTASSFPFPVPLACALSLFSFRLFCFLYQVDRQIGSRQAARKAGGYISMKRCPKPFPVPPPNRLRPRYHSQTPTSRITTNGVREKKGQKGEEGEKKKVPMETRNRRAGGRNRGRPQPSSGYFFCLFNPLVEANRADGAFRRSRAPSWSSEPRDPSRTW